MFEVNAKNMIEKGRREGKEGKGTSLGLGFW